MFEKNYNKAYQFLEIAQKSYLQSVPLCQALADFYKDKGEEEKAKLYLKKAEKLYLEQINK